MDGWTKRRKSIETAAVQRAKTIAMQTVRESGDID